MSNYVPWQPGRPTGPARFGLTQDQWRAVCALQHRYATNSHGDRPAFVMPARMRFLKFLVASGRVNEGERR